MYVFVCACVCVRACVCVCVGGCGWVDQVDVIVVSHAVLDNALPSLLSLYSNRSDWYRKAWMLSASGCVCVCVCQWATHAVTHTDVHACAQD